MAEVEPSSSVGEAAAELVREASCSGADGSTSPGSIPSAIPAGSPSFLTWMCIQILTACSGVWGARGGGLSGPRTSGIACGAYRTQEDSESEVLSGNAASKSTWSEVPGGDIRQSVSVPRSSEELKASAPNFFKDWGDDVQLGPLIAEGGQAHIFELGARGLKDRWVVKVFKVDAGFSLADLKLQWPRSMRKDWEGCSESSSMPERSSKFVFEDIVANIEGDRCTIIRASLLKDGRFAFLMERYWGDLRTLIDQKVEENMHGWEFGLFKSRKDKPPFSFRDSRRIMYQIATGMQRLHEEGVLHRDLKAANVLVRWLVHSVIICEIADYECAMFVQGTGFWRAPEVWQELQKSPESRNADIWTEKVDVYSFGMTCYEILTGQIPFAGCANSKWGDVIRGERPFLPDYVFPELWELVEACWHAQPSQRPSFEVICTKLHSLDIGNRLWI